jgi:hypothetical protein
MKYASVLMIAAFGLGAPAGPAPAGSFWFETFSYPAGPLVANSGGTWIPADAAGTDLQVTPDQYIHGVMCNNATDYRAFPARGVDDKTFACFRVMIPAQDSGRHYFACFMDIYGNRRAKVFAFQSLTLPTYAWSAGVSVGADPSQTYPPESGVAVWGPALNFGRWYTLVVEYDAAQGLARLWVNPVDELSPHVTAQDTTSAGVFKHAPLSAFVLRQAESIANCAAYLVDDIGVGASLLDACGAPTPALPTTWGQVKGIYR